MTTLGHSLTGLAVFTFIVPAGLPWKGRMWWAILFVALASIPDWPLPFWGHSKLAVSHSVWVNLALCMGMAALIRKWPHRRFNQMPLLWAAALTWLSHLFLDTLYGDLPGIAINWPFGDGLTSLPLPWLKSLPHVPPPFDATVINIFIFEFLTLSPLILLAYGLRRRSGGN